MYHLSLLCIFVQNNYNMARKKERFFVYLQCKPYVKQYLIHEYGKPDTEWPEAVSLSSDKFLNIEFRSRLMKPSSRWNNKYDRKIHYTETVPVEIRKSDFYEYGWSLSSTDTASFCSIIESRAKSMMYTYIGLKIALGISIATAILEFQDKYNFTEDIWSAESIRRDYSRNGNRYSIQLAHTILFDSLYNNITGKLSQNRTISLQGLSIDENTSI